MLFESQNLFFLLMLHRNTAHLIVNKTLMTKYIFSIDFFQEHWNFQRKPTIVSTNWKKSLTKCKVAFRPHICSLFQFSSRRIYSVFILRITCFWVNLKYKLIVFSIVDISNHESITWTLMVGSYVCIRGGTQFVCVRLFCPLLFRKPSCWRNRLKVERSKVYYYFLLL